MNWNRLQQGGKVRNEHKRHGARQRTAEQSSGGKRKPVRIIRQELDARDRTVFDPRGE